MAVKQMTTQEIVEHACKREGVPYEHTYVTIAKALEQGLMRIMRHGNTLFAYTIPKPHVAEVNMLTADNANDLVKAFRNFDLAMRKAGFTKMISDVNDIGIFTILKRAGLMFKTTKTDKGSYILTIKA